MSALIALCVVMVALSIAFATAGYFTGRETDRMSRRDTKPHHRANRDHEVTP